MASQIIVDQLKKTGGVLTALTLPSVNATTGQYMQNDGSGGLSWVAAPTDTQGVTHSSIWRLNTTFSNSAAVINANLEAVDAPVGFGSIGAAMTEASGVFTFPVTGIWLIQGHFYYWQNGNGTGAFGTGFLNTTIDDSAYAEAASCRTSDYYSAYGSMTVQYIFDVTSTANCKCSFQVTQGLAAAQIIGDTSVNKTYFTFTKLGDT
jgi:hypothetical protein